MYILISILNFTLHVLHFIFPDSSSLPPAAITVDSSSVAAAPRLRTTRPAPSRKPALPSHRLLFAFAKKSAMNVR